MSVEIDISDKTIWKWYKRPNPTNFWEIFMYFNSALY